MMKRIVTITIILVFIAGCIDMPSKSVEEKEMNIVKNPVTIATKSPVMTVTPIQTAQTTNTNFVSIANKTMSQDDIWDIGNGWSLKAYIIDIHTDSVWLVLTKDGNNVLDTPLKVGKIFSYNKSNRFFSLKVSSIYPGIDKHKMIDRYYDYEEDFVLLEDITYKVD